MSIAESLAAAFGMKPDELAFWMGFLALVLAVTSLVKHQVRAHQERTFRRERRQHELDKEIFRKRGEVADMVIDLLEFLLKHCKAIVETKSLDNAEESLRWVLSKQNSMGNLTVQFKRYFGKELAVRYAEILDKIKIMGRMNEKEKTYEMFLLPREEAEQIVKRLAIKVESLQEAVIQASERVK